MSRVQIITTAVSKFVFPQIVQKEFMHIRLYFSFFYLFKMLILVHVSIAVAKTVGRNISIVLLSDFLQELINDDYFE